MKITVPNVRWFALFLALIGIMLGGCATTESDNQSARPWNSPHPWETGLPSGILNGR
jgi:hypothetical protein